MEEQQLENNAVPTETNETTTGAVDYINFMKNVHSNYVSKEDYEKIVKDNRMLAEALSNGDFNTAAPAETEQQKPSIDDLREQIKHFDNLNDVQIIETALELRNALIEEEGRDADPFLPKNRSRSLTEGDYAIAQKVADGFEHCVEFAQGNNEVFINELQRIMNDSLPFGRRK